MSHGARFILGAACLLLLVSLVAGPASANRLSQSHSEFGLIWEPTFTNSFASVTCERIILIGSFHERTFTKSSGILIAHFTEGSITGCTGGTAQVLAGDLPIHFTYDSFTGSLPNIDTIHFRIIGLAISATVGGTTCLYRSTVANPAGIIGDIEAGGAVASVRSDETLTIPTTSGFPCSLAGNASISGEGSGVENPVVFRLI